MNGTQKITITNDDGQIVKASAPVIVSASRRTDIPAFYCDWFFRRLGIGHCAWINPYNQAKSYISFARTRCIVFWSKNPERLMKYHQILSDLGIQWYIQFTLNDYEKERLEPNLPPIKRRLETFKKLSDMIGSEKVVWRFDPLVLSDDLKVSDLLTRIADIAESLSGYTRRLVISFADIERYRKVKCNMKTLKTDFREFKEDEMIEFAEGVSRMNKKWNLIIQTCAESIDLSDYDISHGSCIDRQLLIELFPEDKELMRFLGKTATNDIFDMSNATYKDKGQRNLCQCIESKDVGQYDTCPHGCVYCYANTSAEVAKSNYLAHLKAKHQETIIYPLAD